MKSRPSVALIVCSVESGRRGFRKLDGLVQLIQRVAVSGIRKSKFRDRTAKVLELLRQIRCELRRSLRRLFSQSSPEVPSGCVGRFPRGAHTLTSLHLGEVARHCQADWTLNLRWQTAG